MQNKSQKDKATTPVYQTDAIRAAAEYGIDIPMLTANLKRTPAERIRRHQMALDSVLIMRKDVKEQE